MQTIFLNETYSGNKDCVATIGFFDGVHKGHEFLIRRVITDARRLGLAAAVVTFDRHPREVLGGGNGPGMLCTLEERIERIGRTGIDFCFVVPFSREVSMLSAHDFMKDVLKGRLGVQQLVIGYDNRFGHDRTEGFEDYVRFGSEMGMEVLGCSAFQENGVYVSSSVIRGYLSNGQITEAAQCLGYQYSLTARVVRGEQEGRKMGFPTANLDISHTRKLIPQLGVYAVYVHIGDDSRRWLGMMNIGRRPTFGDKPMTAEVHILDFNGDLYGKELSVAFIRRLRGERLFASPEELAEQLRRDCMEVKTHPNLSPNGEEIKTHPNPPEGRG